MPENGVTHKELNVALGAQTALIIATMRRSEDRQREDNKAVSDRVTHIERQGRTENIIASVLSSIFAFLGAIVYNRFTGGSG